MAVLAHDTTTGSRAATLRSGLSLAMVSAASFGISGALASPFLQAGWSPGAVVLIRVGIGALALLPFALASLRGRWNLLRGNTVRLLSYGLTAVAVAQFCYFSAVQYLQVGTALLIEFTAPAVVVVWLWLRHGQRPGVLTLAGAALAAVGLVLVLQLLTGAQLNLIGVLWALGAMTGAATYFLMSANDSTGLPPLVMACGGLIVATLGLGALGVIGALPMHIGGSTVTYSEQAVWAVPALVVLGLFTSALPYTAGIGATRRLGSRLASFVALSELLFGVAWAWALLAQAPRPLQILGGVLVLAGVTLVKLGERPLTASRVEPLPA